MAQQYKTKKQLRRRRHQRLRRKVIGTAERPRLAVSFSNQNIYAQFIDDEKGHTLAAISSLDKAFREGGAKGNVAGAETLGQMAAERAGAVNITKVVFDRGGYHYHGRVKAFADSVRKGGIEF